MFSIGMVRVGGDARAGGPTVTALAPALPHTRTARGIRQRSPGTTYWPIRLVVVAAACHFAAVSLALPALA